MKIRLDRPRCEGHGVCEAAASDLVRLDNEGGPALAIRSSTAPSATQAAHADLTI